MGSAFTPIGTKGSTLFGGMTVLSGSSSFDKVVA